MSVRRLAVITLACAAMLAACAADRRTRSVTEPLCSSPTDNSVVPTAPSAPSSTPGAAAGLYAPDRVVALIALDACVAMSATAQDLARGRGLRIREIVPLIAPGDGLIVFDLPPATDALLIATALESDPRVRLAQPDFFFTTSAETRAAPSDLGYGFHLLGVPHLPRSADGTGVIVALVDTAVDSSHPALATAAIRHVDVTGGTAVPELHGTLVAGIIVAATAPGANIVGVAPGTTLLAIRACQASSAQALEARCTSSTVAKGVDAAVARGAHAVNLSVGGRPERLVARVVNAAVALGVVIVAAAGNGGPQGGPSFPASMANVIAVTAVDARQQLYPLATRGEYIDLAAPGVEIVSTATEQGFRAVSGTSFAAPFVTGAVALLLQQQPHLSPEEVQALLEATAHRLGPGDKDDRFGSGLVDVCRAIAMTGPTLSC